MVWLWLGFYHDALSDDTRFKLLLRYPHSSSYEDIDDTELYAQIFDEYCKAQGDEYYQEGGTLEIRANPGILAYRQGGEFEFFENLNIGEIQQLAAIAKTFDVDEFEEINAKDRNAPYLYRLYSCMWNHDIYQLLQKELCKDVVEIVVEYLNASE